MRSPVILRVFKDAQLIEVKQFDLDQIVIGQQAEVQLDLTGPGISPIHCLIERRDNGYYICDLGSETGTFKNEQAVLDDVIVSGDEFRVGPYRISFFVGVPKPKAAPGVTAAAPAAVPPVAVPPPAPAAAPVAPPVEPKITAIPAGKPAAEVPRAVPAEKTKAKENRPATAPVPIKPPLRSAGSAARSTRKKSFRSFAPPSQVADLGEHLKPGKGNVVEVVIAWRDRVIDSKHFRTRGNYRLGTTDRDAIRIAGISVPRGFNLLEIGNAVRVNVTDAMQFELVSTSQGRRKLEDCVATGKAARTGNGTAVRLDQNEMICLNMGDINLYIRYAPQAPVVPLLPPLGLTGTELSGLIMALVLTSLLAFYISATTPKDLTEETQDEITHAAKVIFNTPPDRPPAPQPPPVPPPEEVKPPPAPPPEKAKVAEIKQENQRKGKPTNQPAQRAQTAGRAQEVAPIPNSQNRPKKFTSTRQGGAVKIGEKAGANANSSKDLSKVGLFSAFGGGGVRNKLDQAYSGAGEVLGQADKATGSTGFGENRAGDDLGSKFKDTGAGGKGTATQGIAGIGTKGRGSGQSAYGSADGLGSRTAVAIEAGGAEEAFVGTIDREAVRRRVRHYLHEIRGCYTRELNRLEKGQRLEGKVVVSWEIIAKGVARNVRIKSSTLGNPVVENCIRDRLASWNFPEPPVGMTAEVAYPFMLQPQDN